MLKTKGFNALIKELRNFDAKKLVQDELTAIGNEILRDAVAHVPVDTGELKQSAGIETRWEEDALIVSVFFSARYAAWVEFGTGAFVDVPSGLEDYAMEFYVNGKGTTRPQPYLFPAYFKVLPTIIKRLEDAIKSQQIFT